MINAQEGLRGSYVVAGIGNDGVIMASDSRLVFFDSSLGKDAVNLGYFDSCVKVFVVGKFAIGFVGNATIGNVFLGEMVRMYENEMPFDISIEMLIPDFINHFDNILPPSGKERLAGVKIFAVGYSKDKPRICAAKNENGQWLHNNDVGTAITSDKGIFVEESSDTMSCEQLADLADFSINHYIDETKTTSVGGLISVLKITKEGQFEWIRNKPAQFPWPTTVDLLKDYFDNKVTIHFFESSNKLKLETMWRKELLSYNIIR